MNAAEFARVVIALAIAVAVAIVAALPAVHRWEKRLGLSVLVASGIPLLLLGYFFRYFGVLSDNVMRDLRPAYEFGLAWIGFVVGMNLNLRRLDDLPPSFPTVLALVSLPATILAALTCSLTLLMMNVLPGSGLIRDTLILAACAAVSAPANLRLLLRGKPEETGRMVTAITQVDQIAALAILAFVASTFRPVGGVGVWQLTRSGWFVVTLGLGLLIGVVVYVTLRNVRNRTEELTLLVGGIALAAGTAGYLAVSIPVVCALGGAVLTNLPYADRPRLESTLLDAERTVYLLFLFIVGTFWQPLEWQGWVLGAVFAVARGYGKWVGARAAHRAAPEDLPPPRILTLALLPESAVAIVVIFSAATFHGIAPTPEIRWGINAVIVGSVLTELYVQAMQRREAKAAGEETGPVVSHFV